MKRILILLAGALALSGCPDPFWGPHVSNPCDGWFIAKIPPGCG